MSKPDRYRCFDCSFTTNTSELIRKHVLCMHSAAKQPVLKQSNHISDPHPLSCSHCNFKAASAQALATHSASHAPGRLYSCYICKQMLADKTQLKAHLTTHSDSPMLQCDLCTKKFARISTLHYHRKTHIQQKDFTCHVCQKVFCDVMAFKQHESLHKEVVVKTEPPSPSNS